MARIVFAGELESSGDRLHRLIPMAERLQAAGHSVAFVVPDLIAANTLLAPKGIPFVPAPRFASVPLPPRGGASHWKILAALGYDDREFLRARVRAWIALLARLAADAIIIDHAPTARLAARISQRHCLVLDDDRTPPPDGDSDAAVVDNIDAVARALGGTSADRLAELRLPGLPMQLEGKPLAPKDRRRVLFAWELGTNAGHLERNVAIANVLRERGYDVVFAVRDLDLAERLLAPERFEFLPAPSTPLRPPQRATINYSDVLLTCGFDDPKLLGARLRAWTHLLQQLDPDTIVIDHAPTAQLAAYIVNVPATLVASGFCIPPVIQPLPSIQPHGRVAPEQLALADRRVLTAINQALRPFEVPPLSHLSELFARSTQIVTTFKELDPYLGRDTGMYVGPVVRVGSYAEVAWQTAGKIRVLGYMRPFIRGVEALLQVLQTCDAEVKLVLPGAAPALVARYQSERFQIYTEPIAIDPLLNEADFVISYGSAALMAQTLLAGVPLLLLPDVLEQVINSVRVVELGAGIHLHEKRDPASIAAAFAALTAQDRFRVAARAFAAKYRAREPGACERIVAAIEQTF